MIPDKRLKGVLISEIALTIFGVGLLGETRRDLGVLFIFVLSQSAILIYLTVKIIGPLKNVSDVLDSYIEKMGETQGLERLDKQTELTALQTQINPHFLYNTLDSIRGQALIDDNYEIARMVEALGAFFRYSISRTGNLVTLRDELANINNYMLIQGYSTREIAAVAGLTERAVYKRLERLRKKLKPIFYPFGEI
ncbi:histidine kinase [Lachnospiraceae bacterium 42-17]|jgi:hypothetical protein